MQKKSTIIKNDRFLKAARRESVDMTPIWLMRQAGRYLPEYQTLRKQAGSFMTLCKTPDLACEVTLQPIRRYPLDAAILFSDILTIPDAMGLGLQFIEGKGPVFSRPVQSEKDIYQLTIPDLNHLRYVYETIQKTLHELDGQLPLIGFCGSPWTIAAYMLEGESRPGFPAIQAMRRERPLLLHHLLTILAQAVAAHLNAQIQAGVHAVMLFDTWGNLLTTPEYEIFSLAPIQRVIHLLNLNQTPSPNIPVILFTKSSLDRLERLAQSGCSVIGVDESITLREARLRVGTRIALQGNLPPETLLTTPENLRQKVAEALHSYGRGSGHIFNLSHGITPDVHPDQVSMLVDTVHQLSRAYHAE